MGDWYTRTIKRNLLGSGLGMTGAFGLLGFSLLAPAQDEPRAVTFSEHIAPIVDRKCLPCHRTDGVAPFSLATYEEVKKRSELIRVQVLSGSMPPTPVHSDFGDLSLTPPLTSEESVLLQKWIQTDMPEGVRRAPAKPDVWQGTADLILRSPAIKTRAEGVPYWQVLIIDLPKEGFDLASFAVVPNTPQSLRYAAVAVTSSGGTRPPARETFGSMDVAGKSLIGVWAPGYRPFSLPAGASRKLPPNSKLLVQAHYRPTGKEEDGGFSVHLRRSKGPKSEARWITMSKERFAIEANTSATFELEHHMDRDASILAVLPEARFFASRVQLTLVEPDGKTSTVFETFRWDPYWIGNYSPPKPIEVKKGSKLIARLFYNNDDRCRMNEGKVPQRVVSGPRAGDEVCRMHVLLAPLTSE